MSKFTSVVLTLSFVAAMFVSASAQAPDTWTSGLTSAPGGMGYGGACTNGTYLYYIHGRLGAGQRYNPATNTWLAGGLPTPPRGYMMECAVVYAGGYIYAFGDRNQANRYVTRLDPATNTWQDQADMVNNNYGVVAAGAGNYVYLIGGVGTTTACTRFDASNGTSTVMATAPAATGWNRNAANQSMAAYDAYSGLVYVMTNQALYAFTPPAGAGTGSWSSALAACPVSKNRGVIFTGKGRLFALQGTRLDQYFIGTNSWTLRASCPFSFNRTLVGAAQFNATDAYVYGGNFGTNVIYKYNLPAFGNPPAAATTVEQFGSLGITAQAGGNPNLGWTDRQITFRGTVTDVDKDASNNPELVGFEARAKLSSDPTWNSAITVSSGLGGQGVRPAVFNIPSGGDWDWQYHSYDANFNYTPSVGGIPSWTDFNNNAVTPDFRSDQLAPSVPTGIYPDFFDVVVPSQTAGDVTFSWTTSTDNGPAAAIRYEIQVSLNDPAMGSLTASANGIVPTNQTFTLSTSRYNYYWHVRAMDIGGNYSAWSTTKSFRVTSSNLEDNGAGDAKFCGVAAPGSSSALAIGIALLAMSLLVRRK